MYEVLIVGGGLSGLCMGIRLRRHGIESFLILEKSDDVGGTWRDNTYPGCACDVPAHLYSYSFDTAADWSRLYPTQPEIWTYIVRCVDKYKLRPKLRCGVAMQSAEYDESACVWRVRLTTGEDLVARCLVLAMGALHRPSWPDIPGLDRFEGHRFHSAGWDHDYPLEGKRVAVIGTGASSVQFVPQIAPRVSQLFLFQRTPPWVLPRMDRPVGPTERMLLRIAPYRRLFRYLLYWRQEWLACGFTINPRLMDLVKRLGVRHLQRTIVDPELRARVTPDYMPGCKRILTSNDYLPALNRPNVTLVTDPICEVRGHSVVTETAEYPVDAIICGTGFIVTDMQPAPIVGRGGVELKSAWAQGAEAYLGMTVAGFPNLFNLLGPNTGLGHNSVLLMVEWQVHYIIALLDLMRRRQATSLEVRFDVQTRFNAWLQDKMRRSVWSTGCRSWYMDRRGKNTTMWPDFTFRYWMRTRRPRPDDFILEKACGNHIRQPV